MLDAALAYAKRGFPIFPVKIDKHPYTKHAMLDATTDPARIEKMWAKHPHANIALNVGEAGMAVIDLDPGHNLEELEKHVGHSLNTGLSASTPRGGAHLYFSLNEGEMVACSVERLAPHVDVRSFHGYVLLPPSRTKDGAYEWLGEGRPAHRTDEFIRLANSAREKHADRDVWLIDADLEENIEGCTRWLKGDIETSPCRVAIQGQNGDQRAYETAAMCKSYGISEAMAFELMWEHWNDRCIPPWRDDEVDHFERKIENGYKYNTSPPGNVTAAYKVAKSAELFSKVKVETVRGPDNEVAGKQWESENGRFRAVDRAGMNSIKPPAWLINDFLPKEGYALMFGAPSTYKTFLALDIALSIAAGYVDNPVWPGVEACGPVGFVVGEGRSQIRKRVRAWEQVHFHGEQVENFILIDPVPNVSEDPDQFLSLLDKVSPIGYEMVVMDTVGRAMQGVNENAQEHASSFTRMVGEIQHNFGTSVLALHHTGKGDTKTARGSSVFRADVDTEIRVENEGKIVTLTMTKQKDAPEWNRPRHIKLLEVNLLDKSKLDLHSTKSLVAVPVDPKEDKPPVQAKSAAILDIVEAEGMRVLDQQHDIEYTMVQFSNKIALARAVTVNGATVKRDYLIPLRENPDRRIARCYISIGTKEKWRWQT